MFDGLFALVMLGIWLFAVIDVAITDKTEVRNLPKWAWFVIVVLFMALGAVLWFFLGRPTRLFSGARTMSTRSIGTPREPVQRVRRPTRASKGGRGRRDSEQHRRGGTAFSPSGPKRIATRGREADLPRANEGDESWGEYGSRRFATRP